MAVVTFPHAHDRDRRAFLRDIVGKGAQAPLATTLLLLDAAAAIAFAGGLAGAVAAVAEHGDWLPWLGLLLGAGLLRAGLLLTSSLVGSSAARDAKSWLRRRVSEAMVRSAPGSSTLGATLGTIVDEVEAIDGYVARFVPARVAAAIAPMIILVATGIASPVAALILAATLLPFVAVMILAGGAAADETRRQFLAMERLSSIFVDRIRALPLVLAFQAEEREATRIGQAADEVATRTLRVLARAFLSSAALEFFAALSVALVAVYAGFSLLGLLPIHSPEHLTLGRAFFVLALAPEFYTPLRRLAAAYHDRQAAEAAADSLRSLDLAPVTATPGQVMSAASPPEISFRNVTIRYPGAIHPALEHFSLDVARGETIALLGPSGAGKSSLLKLLLGLAPVVEGDVLVDGERLDPGSMVAAGYAGQSPILIAGSLAGNIALGSPDVDEAGIRLAAEAVGLGPAIGRRAQGLGAWIDERGGGLSGGERRRIGLARALLARSRLLLLDEPTAHLDDEAEQALVATIAGQIAGRTVLIATHSRRLAAIADRVIELAPHP